MIERHEETFRQRDTGGSEARGKMSNIISFWAMSHWPGEMQMKTPARITACTSNRTTEIRHRDSTECWWGWEEPGLLVYRRLKCKTVQPLRKKSEVSSNTKHTTPMWPSSCIPQHLSQRNEDYVQTKTCPQVFTAALLPKPRQPKRRTTQAPFSWRKEKARCVRAMQRYTARNGVTWSVASTWVGRQRILLNEKSNPKAYSTVWFCL